MLGFFLVERYVPSMSEAEVARAAARLSEAAGDEVRHLYTLLVLEEETCLSLFEAPDTGAVETVNARADFQVDRIVETTLIVSEEGRGST
jgi:hypothetical protein